MPMIQTDRFYNFAFVGTTEEISGFPASNKRFQVRWDIFKKGLRNLVGFLRTVELVVNK